MYFIYCHLNFHANLLRPWPFPLNNGRKTQCTTAVNWLLNGHDEHCTEENDEIFSRNSGVCLLFMKWGFFCTEFNFSVKRKEKQAGFFFQFIYLGIDHDHL